MSKYTTMNADDTSREALIERVENLLMDERDKYPRVHNDAPSADLAEAIVDAVVMPLIEAAEAELERLRWPVLIHLRRADAAEAERDRLAAEKAKWQAEAWDEGFSAAWYAALPYEDTRDASESHIPNPYEKGSDDDR